MRVSVTPLRTLYEVVLPKGDEPEGYVQSIKRKSHTNLKKRHYAKYEKVLQKEELKNDSKKHKQRQLNWTKQTTHND